MKKMLKEKSRGMQKSVSKFYEKMRDIDLNDVRISEVAEMIEGEMKGLSFDSVKKDKSGNVIGIIKGYENKDPVVMVSHMNIVDDKHKGYASGLSECKSGIISSIYTAALIKRAMLPLTGDLIVCCVPKFECCDFGIKYLFEHDLKSKVKKIKGVILCEPTDFNIHIGHKGRMEYEIVVKGRLNRNFIQNRGMNMLGAMFPLINELEKTSKELPSDFNLGRSDLRIKDVRYNYFQQKDDISEFRIVVDRVFIPEESEGFILNKAKTIAKKVYNQEDDVSVRTILANQSIKTDSGLNLLQAKELKPWAMQSNDQFALRSLEVLKENGFDAKFGYWKKIVTEGSYTYGELGIPTIGFGAGSEETASLSDESINVDKLQRAIFAQSLMVQRNIGMPTFGWSSDDF
jgi:acetylornithine deacetylase/succinyl-diaminopimelate desuccinylase-like protein